MKKVNLAIMMVLTVFSMRAHATTDGWTSTWLVVDSLYGESDDLSIKEFPMIGCYGLAQGPNLEQFVSEYKVKSTIGCGFDVTRYEDINALTCATIIEAVESEDFGSFKKIVLDISSCRLKNNKRFITLVRTAAMKNFPQSENGRIIRDKEVELILVGR